MDQIGNMRRELEKAREALLGAQKYLGANAEMNAAGHCANEVFYSPLHAKITMVLKGVNLVLNSFCEHGKGKQEICADCAVWNKGERGADGLVQGQVPGQARGER